MCVFTCSSLTHVEMPPPVFRYLWQICCHRQPARVKAFHLPCSWIQASLVCCLFWLPHVFVFSHVSHCISSCFCVCRRLCVRVLHICPSKHQTRPPKGWVMMWAADQGQFWTDWSCFFSPGDAGWIALSPFQSRSNTPAHVIFLPFQVVFLLPALSLLYKQKIDLSKDLKTLFRSQFDRVCGCVGSGPELVTRQQQGWNSSSHRLSGRETDRCVSVCVYVCICWMWL